MISLSTLIFISLNLPIASIIFGMPIYEAGVVFGFIGTYLATQEAALASPEAVLWSKEAMLAFSEAMLTSSGSVLAWSRYIGILRS